MHLREGEYEKAHTDFFEAFKNYDESGSPRYISVNLVIVDCMPRVLNDNSNMEHVCTEYNVSVFTLS